jgi:hypothetical protein
MSEHRSIRRGVGCAFIIPAAFIGLTGLTDGVGPKGWLGFAELLGWFVVCIAISFIIALLLKSVRRSHVLSYAIILVAFSVASAFTYLTNWLGLGAPMTAKVIFTSSLQIIGSLTAGMLMLWITYIVWRDHSSR